MKCLEEGPLNGICRLRSWRPISSDLSHIPQSRPVRLRLRGRATLDAASSRAGTATPSRFDSLGGTAERPGMAQYAARAAFVIANDARIRSQEFEAQARASEQVAHANEANVQQHVYASDMRLANELLKEGEFAAVWALVERHRPFREGIPDRRGFEWWYLRRFRDMGERTWQAHAGDLNLLAYSADGLTLMTASYADQCVKTWDLQSGKLLATFPSRKWDESRDHEAGALSPDGRTAVTLVSENIADVWDARTGNKKTRLKLPGKVFSTSFSPDGRYLVSAAETGTDIWNCSSWEKPTKELSGARLAVFSPDNQTLATAWNPTYSTDVSLYDWRQASLKKRLSFWFPVLELVFSPDGSRMAAVEDGPNGTTIALHDAQTGAWQRNLESNHMDLRHVAFSADRKRLAASTRDGSLRLWDLDIDQPRVSFRGGTSRISQFQFSPDGRTLAMSTDRGSVGLCDISLFAGPEPINRRFLACPGHLTFDHAGKRVAFVRPGPQRTFD